MAAAGHAMDQEAREALIREARARILSEGPVAEASQVALALVVVLLAFGTAPRTLLAGWVAVLVAAVAYHFNVRRRIAVRGYDRAARRAFQLSVGVEGVTWGIGAALFAQWLPFQDVALLLVILCGLVAGATSSVAADRLGYRIFLVGALLPPAVGILAGELERSRLIALLLIFVYGGAMFVLHNRSHAALLERLTTHARLATSEAREASERAQLDALFASAPVAIVVVDEDGMVRDTNPQFHTLFGYGAEEARGKRINDLIVPSGEVSVADQLDRTVRSGERVVTEVERRHKDGTPIPVRASAARIEGFGARELFVMYEDISDDVRARAALHEAKEAAEKLAQMRSSFLANMSHEIRTPLNAVLGLTELLLDGEMNPEQRRSLGLIQASGENLLTLLNDILHLSKIEADGLQLETVPFDLHRLVNTTTSLLAVRAREHGIELLSDIPEPVPEQVRGDPTRLRQVLTNLIGNAVKFTHQGQVLVSLSCGAVREGKTAVRFSVQDTGIGIPEEQRAAIFQPFRQADLSTTRNYGGSGLGLTIAQRLVTLMGGRLDLVSEVGKGSEFFFTIDLAVEAALPPPLPAPGAVQLAGLKMLVVDDNQSNRRIVREMLGTAGVTVDEATDAEEGQAALRRAVKARAPYALAILDGQMPGRDGYQLAQIVRADAALNDTSLMMLTSAGQRGDAQRCRELGIRGYLPKPVSRADLLEMVASVLATAQARGAGAAPEVVTRHRIAESRRQLHILVAEDNLVNQEVAATMLRKRGHTVDVVDNGRDAVERARTTRYDVVLMDIQMPELDGYEATEAIHALAQCKDLPIVALTAHAAADEREKCLARGMNAYLTKPFKAFELFAAAEGGAIRAQPPEERRAAPAGPPPPVDLAGFRRDMDQAGVGDAVRGIIDSFLENQGPRIAAISAAVKAGDTKEVARLSHAFKSSAAQIGAKQLAALLAQLEQAAKDEADALGGRLEALLGEAARVTAYLKSS